MKALRVVMLMVVIMAAAMNAFAEDPPPFILKWGSQGTGNGQFNQPQAVAVDPSGNVFVMDAYNYRIQKFTSEGGFLLKWGQYTTLRDIAVDSNGNVYVLEGGRDVYVIEKYANNGILISSWNVPWLSESVAVGADGVVYVLNYYRTVLKYTNEGTLLAQWQITTYPGATLFPQHITVKGSIVYVVTAVYTGSNILNRIQKYTSDGVLVTFWGDTCDLNGCCTCFMRGGAVDADGNVYVANDNHFIRKYSADGQLLLQWGSYGTGNGQFASPFDVELDPTGNVFVADRLNNRIQKFGPGGASGPGGLAPVVLVHGFCSDAGAWSELEPRLQARGFQTHSLSLTPNDKRPQELVGTLELFLQGIPGSKFSVIGHSMGGLVAREYIARHATDGQNKIGTLITLGTPHHGSDLAALAERDPAMKKVLRPILKKLWVCPADGPAFKDLVTGSDFLNGLNYGANEGKYDRWGVSSKGNHDPEDLRDPSVKFVTIAGTQNFCGSALRYTKGAWTFSLLNFLYGNVEYENDGVVGIDAAKLYAPGTSNYLDDALATGNLSHTGGLATIPLYCSLGTSFQQSETLARILANVMKGGAPVPASQQATLTVAGTTSASDTVLVSMPSPSGNLNVGQAIETPFTVPSTSVLQVLMTSTDARLFLGSPTDPSITPDDTLTTPGLQYVYDSALGLEGYLFENPPAGNWTLRVDGTTATQTQEYATAISIASTNAIAIAATPLYVLAGDSVVVRASIKNLGTPIPGVTWNVTVIRPDSTTFPLALYDDGSHSDSLANDGVFGAVLLPTGSIGFFELEAGGTLPAGGPTLVAGTTFELATFQDLAVDSTLAFSKNLIAAGDSVMVTATVRNLGAGAVQNIAVEFWDNATKFKADSLDLSGNGSGTASATWLAASPDSHTIRVTVSPFTLSSEAQYANNTTTKLVVLGVPVGVGDLPQPRLWLAPPQPNPSNGTVTFRFGLPSSQPAALDLYDLQGRKVRSWQWDVLPAGNHAITWDGRSEHGAPTATGMYFLKFTAGGRTMTQKVVRLR